MRRFDIIRKCFKRSLLSRFAPAIVAAWVVAVQAAPLFAAEQIAVFPAAPFDAYVVYESLAVFWIGIICLIVVIRMKLKEIERIQALGADREETSAPFLE
jgi:hypothetical protein